MDSIHKKFATFIKIKPQLKEEFVVWTSLLQQNSGAPWRSYDNVFLQAEIFSDASGRRFAEIVHVQNSCFYSRENSYL